MENNNTHTTPTNGAEQQVATPKTYTHEEVEKMIQAEADRRVNQAYQKWEKDSQKKLTEAEKLAKMSEDEKKAYQLTQKEQEIAAKEREFILKENKLTASSLLNEKGLPTDLLDFVVSETAEDTMARINKLEQAFKNAVAAQVKTVIGGNSPKASVATPTGITPEKFATMNYKERLELLKSNPELYKRLTTK